MRQKETARYDVPKKETNENGRKGKGMMTGWKSKERKGKDSNDTTGVGGSVREVDESVMAAFKKWLLLRR